MGKRSNFKRKERDFYPTPYEAAKPLMPHLDSNCRFAEPCAGDGALVKHLVSHEHIPFWVSDIEPQGDVSRKADAFTLSTPLVWADCIITNPPCDRKILHPMIDRFRRFAPTWLLFDADWMHTKQSAEFLPYCHKIVSVGRVKWIPDSKMTGKDNCAWYLFNRREGETVFYGRSL